MTNQTKYAIAITVLNAIVLLTAVNYNMFNTKQFYYPDQEMHRQLYSECVEGLPVGYVTDWSQALLTCDRVAQNLSDNYLK